MKPSPTLIKQVDTILLVVDGINDVKHLMTVFTEIFNLPVSWPAMGIQHSFNGCVYAGNVNLEPTTFLEEFEQNLSHIGGIGFEIEGCLPATLEELNRREIPFTDPNPITLTDSKGQIQTHVTTIGLKQLSSTKMNNYLIKYMPIAFSMSSTPTVKTVTQQKTILKNELENQKGGSLGIQNVKEIVVGAINPLSSWHRWQNLFDPIPPKAEGVWQAGEGSAIRIVPATEDKIQSLVIKVRSLDQACTVLTEYGLLGHCSEQMAIIAKDKLNGLELCLVQ